MDGLDSTALDADVVANDTTGTDLLSDSLTISWDGLSVASRVENEITLQPLQENDESPLPTLPEEAGSLERIYWPLEKLLVRTFSLPLSETRHLDAEILAQELEDLTGEECNTWWLTWHVEKTDAGIAGIVFGLPQPLRQAMKDNPLWQHCPHLLIDGWERLTAQSNDFETVALIDEDAEGIFFGYKQQGVWRGIRRINRKLSDDNSLDDARIAQQIRHSWLAMDANDETPVTGHVSPGTATELATGFSDWQVDTVDNLTERNSANLALELNRSTSLNFRHGRWAVKKSWQGLTRWKRPLAMAAGLLLIWVCATAVEIYRLNGQAETYRVAVESAFHRGLPNEKVMLDPLAQLRKAVGVTGSQQQSMQFLRDLDAISQVRKQLTWTLKELSFENERVQMSGSAKDIKLLNRMRDKLRETTGRNVTITDTDLSDGQVSFRMKW